MFRLRAILFTLALAVIHASASAQSPDAVGAARAKWEAGARALRRGDLEGARAAFQAAYDAMPHPELAQSLGEVEFRLHKYAPAARHLSAALNNLKLSDAERKVAQKSLQQSLLHVGALIVHVDVGGADVRVDDELVGTSLQSDEPWYVDPGVHVVRAHKDGFVDASQNVTLEPGATVRVAIALKRHEPAAPEPSASTPSQPQPALDVEPKPATAPPPSLPFTPAATTPPETPPHRERAPAGRTIALVTGVALTGISVGLGTYFVVKHGRDQDHATALRDQAAALGGCIPIDGGPPAAGSALCQSLANAYPPIDTDRTFIGVSFTAAGLLGAATVATLLFWPQRSAGTMVRAAVDPRSKALVIVGSF